MVTPQSLICWLSPEAQFNPWVDWLQQRGYTLDLRETSGLQGRMVRDQQELALGMDGQGLWLMGQGLKMQPDWAGQCPRWQRATLKTERLARAVFGQVPSHSVLQVVDGTAGVGHDGGLLASLGAEVVLLEREPLILALLLDEWERAKTDPRLASIARRIQVVEGNSQAWFDTVQAPIDVVTLDPMFPVRTKTALVRKEMQVLQQLHQAQALSLEQDASWLASARAVSRRVVVKRPLGAPPLGEVAADVVWSGPVCRFDGYLQHHSAVG